MKKKRRKETAAAPQTPRFQLINWLLLAAAIVLIGAGFYSLSRGSITLAPILLVAGYCVVVPLALLLRVKPKEKDHA
ncbi:MAG: hypothetical protein U9Q76_10870 [candidate division WOR-3 bacterium]|jgi:hypothetical protein|nr:hypothetical protein [candidate division WOR-3 bacterium]